MTTTTAFTFGQNYPHELNLENPYAHRDGWVEVTGPSQGENVLAFQERFGTGYASSYPQDAFYGQHLHHYPLGALAVFQRAGDCLELYVESDSGHKVHASWASRQLIQTTYLVFRPRWESEPHPAVPYASYEGWVEVLGSSHYDNGLVIASQFDVELCPFEQRHGTDDATAFWMPEKPEWCTRGMHARYRTNRVGTLDIVDVTENGRRHRSNLEPRR